MKKIRTFFAVPLPDEWKSRFGDVQNSLKENVTSKVSWVKPENMHITLRFLGNLTEAELEKYISYAKNLEFSSFNVSLSGISGFPFLKQPRVVWAGIAQGKDSVKQLAVALQEALNNEEEILERKNFNAHVTLARVRSFSGENWENLVRPFSVETLPVYLAEYFCLYQSELTPSGPVYTELKRFDLS
jgi:2'-5' RNA ligase